MSNSIQVKNDNAIFSADRFDQAMKMAVMLSKSAMCPANYKGKPEEIMLAMQHGYEIGLSPLQSVQDIAVIRGRPSVWGDAMLALCQTNPNFEWIEESFIEENGIIIGAICKVKRVNYPVHVSTFDINDAKTARLWGKEGPWRDYPTRMLQMRARSFALRNTFADSLKGLISREEAMDIPEKESPKEVDQLVETLIAEKSTPLIIDQIQEIIEKDLFQAEELNFSDPIEKLADDTELKRVIDRFKALGIPEERILSYYDLPITEKSLKDMIDIGKKLLKGDLKPETLFIKE